MLNWSCSYPCTFIELCACKMPLVLLAQNGAQVLPCDVCPEGSCKPPAFSPSVLVLGVLLSFCLPGLSIPSGECAAGFYCKGGATLPNPRDDVTGNICPAGTYCSKYPTSIRNKNFISRNI